MLGRVFIDAIDIYAQFGAYVGYGGFDDIIGFAPSKKVESINWPEEDGEQFDLSDGLKLDTRELTIKFNASDIVGLIGLLSDGAYHDFTFAAIGLTKRLRMLSQPNMAAFQGVTIFSLRFADDFPLLGYSYIAPQPKTHVRDCGFILDGHNFIQYDMRPIEGGMDEILKMPNVKKNLMINTSAASGAVYDGAIVRYEAKDVKIPCFMRAATAEDFWHNHNALLFDLIRAGERQLTVGDKTYSCYYKSCQSKEFIMLDGHGWWTFDLTLCFTKYRP